MNKLAVLALVACIGHISGETYSGSSCLAHKDFSKFTHCISKREISKCYDGGCITCLKGRCMQTCVGEKCNYCPTGSCCDGKNCNICIDGTCCTSYQCNSCIRECKESCLTTQCREACTASCISKSKVKAGENTLNDQAADKVVENDDYDIEEEEEDEERSQAIVGSSCSEGCTGSCASGSTPCTNSNCSKRPCGTSTCGSSCNSGCNSPCSSSCSQSSCSNSSPCSSNRCQSSSCGSSSCGSSICNSRCSSPCSSGCSSSRLITALTPSCGSSNGTNKRSAIRGNRCQ